LGTPERPCVAPAVGIRTLAHNRGMRIAGRLTTLLAVLMLLLAGCGGGEEEVAPAPDETPGAFLERIFTYGITGQPGRDWDVLHPAHQKVVTRKRYVECKAKGLPRGIEVDSFDVIELSDVQIDADEVPEKTAKEVTYRVTTSLGDERYTSTQTGNAVQVGDHWVWTLNGDDYRAFKGGTCPP
jgi:hypothetical protein